MTRLLVATLLFCAFFAADGNAQKKKSTSEDKTAAAAPAPSSKGSSFADILTQYQGLETNKGTLLKVTNEYVMFEEEGVTTYYRIGAVWSVTVTKPQEEGDKVKINIGIESR